MNVVLASFVFALLLVMAGLSNGSLAGTPGVSVGNTATYGNVSFDWFSNAPNATPPVEWSNLNGTAWFKGTVQSIVGSNVTISTLSHASNGTEETGAGWVDVDTGEGNMTLFLVAANLNVSDPVYTNGTYSSFTVNETIPMTYPGGDRLTNHVNVTMAESSVYFNFSLSMDLYWDKATGILTQMSIVSNQTLGYTTYYAVSMQLTDSNVWTVVPEFGMPLIALLLSSAAVVTLAATRKLRRTRFR